MGQEICQDGNVQPLQHVVELSNAGCECEHVYHVAEVHMVHGQWPQSPTVQDRTPAFVDKDNWLCERLS